MQNETKGWTDGHQLPLVFPKTEENSEILSTLFYALTFSPRSPLSKLFYKGFVLELKHTPRTPFDAKMQKGHGLQRLIEY
ncbi:hypothetical protein RJT34_05823 [Clitoria ternatea]|uniref:Uncharacterized protein n=1 Tax=Clitoria ternatea TaxID=43366 RepID=A0AAN9K1W7_CLITE